MPGTGGYNYSEVFAAEEADDLREGLSVYLNFEDALTTNSASQSAQKVEVQCDQSCNQKTEQYNDKICGFSFHKNPLKFYVIVFLGQILFF